ncbi:MAG: manganese-dependent inorganic pyrophosphatase [Rhodobacteraceae bacterium]|nr:manganese-dependent inorganic pyrophosphatase [Paracoccaceae bacterium]
MIKIFGHKSPDTDSTGSPIIWEWYLNEIAQMPAQACLLGPPSNEALFVLDHWGFEQPPTIDGVEEGDEVVIVDTNNVDELPEGIGKASIIQIIDHHLLQGGLSTSKPIEITMRPVACTATVMHDLMGDSARDMPSPIRGMMLSCILSDTLAFRSPTTTSHDRILATNLASGLGVDISEFSSQMFAAKSDVSMFSDAELLLQDSKRYQVGGKWLRITVLETTTPEQALARKSGLMNAMNAVADSEATDQILLFVVDILNNQSTLLVPNSFAAGIASLSFDVEADADAILLPGVVSRKKQIIPCLKVPA